MPDPRRLLVFGASGAIGGAVVARARARDWTVIGVGRGAAPDGFGPADWRRFDPLRDDAPAVFADDAPFDGVAFAQGANSADSIQSFDLDRHLELYRANCLSVMAGLSALHQAQLLAPVGARIAVVSSIWQERARADKLSYTVTKAALGGLVRSAAVDLGREGHLINAVLPGVLDTPMTAANVTAQQLAAIRAKTTLGRLPDLDTVAELICFLCSADNASINGQSIAVDLGMSDAQLF